MGGICAKVKSTVRCQSRKAARGIKNEEERSSYERGLKSLEREEEGEEKGQS